MREIHEIAKPALCDTLIKDDEDNGIHITTIGNQTLRYRKGLRYEFEEFHKLKNGGTYILEPATERNDLKQYTGDRWRRLRVAIDPMRHVESQNAIKEMKRGSLILDSLVIAVVIYKIRFG